MTTTNNRNNPDADDWKSDTFEEPETTSAPLKRDLRELRQRVQCFAGRNSLESVRAFSDCERALLAAISRRIAERAPWVERAHRHFQILKAAAAEKASRGKA